jgi:cytochrome c biogenesis protein CcmG/thiol:disulfide interchange protein DsbE
MSTRRRGRHVTANAGGRPPIQAARTAKARSTRTRRGGGSKPTHLAVYAVAALVVIAGLVLVVHSGINAPPEPGLASSVPATVEAGPLAIGKRAPDFSAATFDGGPLSLASLQGRPVMVNFFASWCTSCAHELPAIQASNEAHRSEGFVVVGVNTLENGDGTAFFHRFGLTFPAVHDPGHPGRIGAAYGVTQGLPASVFIHKRGNIDLIVPGEVSAAMIENELRKLQ